MLYRTPELEPKELEVLRIIQELWRELRFSLQHQPRRWTGLLARTLRARAIQGSNSIEGYIVTQEDALAAVDGESPEEADPTAWVNVLHYREAMDYVLRLADASDFAYSKDLLRSLHYMMTRHDSHANPGTWRGGPISVRKNSTQEVVYKGPAAEDVHQLTSDLVDELNHQDSRFVTPIVRGAMAHLNLVMIHPFSDGNGRMARCLQTLVLARGGVLAPTFSSIEEYLGRNTAEYYRVLAKVGGGSYRPKRDTRPWIRFCLTAHYRQAKTAQLRLQRISAMGEEIETHLKTFGLPERAAPSLVNTALGDKLRNTAYRHHADVSMQLASRDLKALTDAGLLKFRGEKRGRYYEAGRYLVELAQRHPMRSKIEDPF